MGGFGRKPPAINAAPPLAQLELYGVQAWVWGYLALGLLHMAGVAWARAYGSPALKKEPHLAAHLAPQLLGFVVIAAHGTYGWLYLTPAHDSVADIVGAYSPISERISCLMISFQLYELSACVPAARLRGATRYQELVCHHVMALLLAALTYYYAAFTYYTPFYMALTELSSVPLAVMDHFKAFPGLRPDWPLTNEYSRYAFAALFLPIRGVAWPLMSVPFFRDALPHLGGHARVPVPVMAAFCVGNVTMTLLQWYWTSLILKAVAMKASGDERHKDQ